MKSYRKELTLQLPKRKAFIRISSDIRDSVRESGLLGAGVAQPYADQPIPVY